MNENSTSFSKDRAVLQPRLAESSTLARAPSRQRPGDDKLGESFPIVGIGASAGGLEALTMLFAHVGADTGMAFVIVQHLDPHRESALAELLSRSTQMAVTEVSGRTAIEPNHVYVIPPGSDISFSKGALTLRERPTSRAPHLSIDVLFESLARDLHEHAIGVILSGTATDGTLGLEAIKAEGGITFAQDDSAKYDSMPRSAIAAGCVDFVLSPAKIASELERIANHPYVRGQTQPRRRPTTKAAGRSQPHSLVGGRREELTAGTDLEKIMALLHNRSRVDFTLYKPSTIQRRIARRMVLGKFEAAATYAKFLQRNPKELDALFTDLLIGVTSFFRNPDAFATLKRRIFPQIFKHNRQDPIRVWTLGCSSGQEAYSIAMLLIEHTGDSTVGMVPIQVYATDLNESALNKARQGLYPKHLLADVSAERLKRFFVEEHGGYRVNKMLREMCVFARHNLLNDPPFSRMDLITCRNLLIYLEPETQKQIFPSFHYALKPGGCLFLGASESIGPFAGLFEVADKKEKVYFRKGVETPVHRLRPMSRDSGAARQSAARSPVARAGAPMEMIAQREADRITLKQYAPPAVLVNDRLQIVQFRGSTGRYLEPASGRANFHLLQMAREGLMLPLRAAINDARKAKQRVVRKNVGIRLNGGTRKISIEVTPLRRLIGVCYLISFKEARHREYDPDGANSDEGSSRATETMSGRVARQSTRRLAELERELSETRDYLQSLQEQHEASNEETQASNEEGQSANEELQSINEELETSKEELESSNEELITLNEEMLSRNADLNRLNSDLNNLHLSINTAILVLGRDLRIRRFTPAAEKLFNLVATDLGRPIGGIRSGLDFHGLEAFVLEVIESVALREREVQDKAGKWFLLRVRPYLTLDNEIDGAVLVLIDIDALKSSEHAVGRARDYSNAILRTARDSMIVMDAELHVTEANEAYYRLFQTTAAATERNLLFKIGRRRWDDPKLRASLKSMVTNDQAFNDLELATDVPGRGRRTFLLHGRTMLSNDQKGARRLLLSFEDTTERMIARDELRQSETRYRRLFETAQDGILLVHPGTRKIVDANPYMSQLLGYTHAQLVGKDLHQIGLTEDEAASKASFRELRKHGFVRYDDLPLETNLGERREVEFVSNLYVEDGVEIIQCSIRDVSFRKKSEAQLRQHERFMFNLIDQSPVGTLVVDEHLTLLQINALGLKTLGHISPLLGRDYAEIVHEFWGPIDAQEMVMRFRHTLGTGEPYTAPEYSGRRFDGETSEIYDWELQRLTRPDGRFCVVSYFNNVTDRFRTKTKLAGQARWAGLLSQISAQLILTTAPNASLGSIFERMADELGVEVSLNYSVTNDGRKLILEHAAGISIAERDALKELHVHEGLGASVGNNDEQVTMLSVADDPHPDFEALRRMGAKTYVSHPLRVGSTLLGIAVVISLSRPRFDPEELKFIRTICDLSAATEERGRLLKDTARARDVAQAANKAKDDFLGAVSHELRTPLNPVLLLASERAEDLTLPAAVRNDFEVIARNVALEARLIDDLLDLTRATHSKLAMHMGVVDVHAILTDALTIVQPELAPKAIELTVSTGAPNAMVRGDPLRLQQVLWNVLHNAVKFTPEGGRIVVTTKGSVNGERLYVSVADSGIGMSPEELGRVFERFTQGDHATDGGSIRFGGLGLGLSISRTLIEAHGGTIEASSAGRNEGTTFLIDIPVAKALASAAVTTDAIVPKPGIRLIPKRRRLLMVEDHDATRFALSNLLRRRGYAVIPAVSVAEARSLLSQQEFDVIVCDIGLPDGTGYDLMLDVKKRSQAKGIALTGYGSDADVAHSLACGFSSHVTKPVSIQALTQALAALEVE
ncbi:MAG: chemotaxis protein CheB [Opitutus sp.]